MSRRARRKPLLIAVTLVPVLLLAADVIAWRWATERLRAGLDGWVAARRAAGWTVSHETPAARGWPLAATLTVPELSMAGAERDIPGGVAWSAQRLTLSVAFAHPGTLHADLAGRQTLRVGAWPAVALTAATLSAAIPLDPGAPPRAADITLHDLRAQADGSDGALSVGEATAHVDWRPAAAQGEAAVAFTIAAEAIALPEATGETWALGRRMSSLSADGALDGPLPSGAGPGLAARAAAWRDGGGTLDVRRLALGWGPLGLSARATLALDDALQPMGTGSARLVGYSQALEQLARAGVVTPGAALGARAVLSLIARPNTGAEGGEPAAEVPLTLRDRTLSMRQMPLMRVSPLVWPPP